MKILMVSFFFPPRFGGSVVQALRLARVLRKKGYEIEFLTNNLDQKTERELYEGFPVSRVRTSAQYDSKLSEILFTLKILICVISRPDIRLVHFHSLCGLEILILPILRLFGKKIILKLTLMGSDDPLTFKRRKNLGWFYFQGLKFVDRFIAISPGLKQMALEAGIPEGKIELIDNGLNIEHFYPATNDEKLRIRADAGLKNFGTVFISIGKIEARKGYAFLLQAWESISRNIEGGVLLIIGPENNLNNPYFHELTNFLKERNMNNVLFLGKIDNVAEYVRASDCFLFCSKAEGFGTVMVEAMACGVPIVALNIDGVTDFILEDRNISDICYSNELGDFAEKVLKILRIDKQQLDQASIKVRNRYDIDHVAEKYDALYQQLK